MYLDGGPEEGANPITIIHQFTGSDEERLYRYKVSQIECGGPTSPDRGCQMYYFGGPSGTIESYNFQGEFHLNNQMYT